MVSVGGKLVLKGCSVADYLLKQRQGWYAVLEIPKDLRRVFGKSRFKQTLNTQSRAEAKIRVLGVVQGWKHQIQAARDPSSKPYGDPNAWRQEIARLRPKSEDWEIREALSNTAIEIGDDAVVAYSVAVGEQVLLAEHLESYLDKVDDPKSKDMKSRHLRLFLQEFRLASDVTQDSVEDWVDRKLFRDMGITVKTAKTYLSTYRTFWRHLNKLKLVDKSLDAFKDVLPEVKKSTQPKRDYFTPEDYRRLLQGVLEHDGVLGDLIQLGAYTGCRIEELCNLKIQNVSADYLKIADAKTEAGIRKVPLHSAIRQLVARLRDTSSDGYLLADLTFNKYGDRSNAIGKRFGNLKRKLGYGPEHVFHSFRRGVVTQFEEAGVPENIAARIVGHDYKTITFGTYSGGASINTMQEAIEVLRW